MNEMLNKFLLVGDKFISKMHLRQPAFTYSTCDPFTKSKEKIKKFKVTGLSRFIYQNELNNACFQYHMDYEDFLRIYLE